VDIELLDDVKWDGILGLAYPNPSLTAQGIRPLFDTMMSSGVLSKLANQFAYYIDDHRGAVTFGGADCELIKKGTSACIDQFHFVPVVEKTYWTVRIKDVRIKHPNQPERGGFCGPDGCKAIVDTGTYLIYGPSNQVTSMVTRQLRGCEHHGEMPTFTFDFALENGGVHSVTLAPIDYILKFENHGREECVTGISPDKDTIWTLGQVFLRSFYTVFDRDRDRIGFARLPRTRFAALNSASVSSDSLRHPPQSQQSTKSSAEPRLREAASATATAATPAPSSPAHHYVVPQMDEPEIFAEKNAELRLHW
jgi:hypothetical protein